MVKPVINIGNGNWAVKTGKLLGYRISESGRYVPLEFDFTRSTNATRVGKDGFIQQVSANKPRIDYLNDSDGEFLLEPQRTNLLVNSNGFEESNWNLVRTFLSTESVIAPDGSGLAYKLSPDSENNNHIIYSRTVAISDETICCSTFVKKESYDYIYVGTFSNAFNPTQETYAFFNISNGTLGSAVGNIEHYGIEDYGNGWYRCYIVITPKTVEAEITIGLAQNDNETEFVGEIDKGVFIWGAQAEYGAFPTSYIPTNDLIVSRDKDYFELTSLGLNELLSESPFLTTNISVFLDGYVSKNDGDPNFISFNDGTDDIRFQVGFWRGYVYVGVRNLGSLVDDIQQYYTTEPTKTFYRFSNNQLAICYDGNLVTKDISPFSSITTELSELVSNNTSVGYMQGRIKKLEVFGKFVSNSEMINKTI